MPGEDLSGSSSNTRKIKKFIALDIEAYPTNKREWFQREYLLSDVPEDFYKRFSEMLKSCPPLRAGKSSFYQDLAPYKGPRTIKAHKPDGTLSVLKSRVDGINPCIELKIDTRFDERTGTLRDLLKSKLSESEKNIEYARRMRRPGSQLDWM